MAAKFPGEVIQLGYNKPDVVKRLKERLNVLGYGPLTPSIANIGTTTVDSIKRFQRAHGLLADGKVGELTWLRLFGSNIVAVADTSPIALKAVEIAKSQLHVREKTGHNDGKEVGEYLASVGLGQGYSWCMAYQYWLFGKAADALRIDNPLPKTAGVLDCLAKSKEYVVEDGGPQIGDLGVMDFGSGKGHIFLVTGIGKYKNVFTNEGNTKADPSYAAEDREGNGVFERNRPISTVKKFIRYV